VARVSHYLDSGTEAKIKEVAERELISVHMKALVEVHWEMICFFLPFSYLSMTDGEFRFDLNVA
jgi:hypothetical protein